MSERREIDGLGVRTPIGTTLPALFQEDELIQRWCAGLDDVLAPLPSTLDNLWAYIDPNLAPADFVEWLSVWVGLELDQTWTLSRRRSLISQAHRLHDYRGTRRGLEDLIELYVGVRPEITEPGSSTWSATPGADIPAASGDELVVTVRVDDTDAVDAARLEELVEANKPAHLPHRVEIVAAAPRPRGTRKKAAAPPPPPPGAQPSAGDDDLESDDGDD